MKTICPNLKNEEVKQQFDELKSVLGEDVAYFVWSYNNGNSLDYAPNGALSNLFTDLLDHYNGDRASAIIAKAKTYSPSFREWFGDWLNDMVIDDSDLSNPLLLKDIDISKVIDKNGEPLLVYHNSGSNFEEFKEGEFDEYERFGDNVMITGTLPSGIFFTTDKDYARAYGSVNYACFLNLRNPNVSENADLHSETVAKFREIDEFAAPQNGIIPADGLIGHDVKTFTGLESKGTEYVAFYPNQIKSVDNQGMYSTDNNIYKYAPDYVLNNIGNVNAKDTIFNKQSIIENDSIDYLFSVNKDLQKIGSKQEYLQYLETIFPDSKLKSVYWHGTDSDFSDGLNTAKRGKGSGASETGNEMYFNRQPWASLQYISGINRNIPDEEGYNNWVKLWWEMKEILGNGRMETDEWKNEVIGPDIRLEIPNKKGVFNRNTGGKNGSYLSDRKKRYGYLNKSDKKFFEDVFDIRYGKETFQQWIDRKRKLFQDIWSSKQVGKGIVPALLNVLNPIVEEGLNTYYEEQRHLLTKAKQNSNDAILSNAAKNEFGSDVAIIFNARKNVHFLGTTSDLDSFSEWKKNNKPNEKKITAKQALSKMLNDNRFFTTIFEREIAKQLLNNLDDSVSMVLDETNEGYEAAYKNGTVHVNPRIFDRYNNSDISRIILHELVHHFTVDSYNLNNTFKDSIDKVYNKISELFPESKYKRSNPLYYGLASPHEFISEVYTNSAFRDLVAKKNMSLWRRLLSNILRALKLTKMADKVSLKGLDNTIALTNEISDIINRRLTDPSINTLGDGILNYNPTGLSDIEADAKESIETIISGLKSSYRSLKSRDKSPVMLAKLQQTIDEYEFAYQNGDDITVLTSFIKRASEQFSPVLKTIRKAYLDTTLLTNDDLINFKNDFLDFYGPVCNDINKRLFSQGYFSNLQEEDLNRLSDDMDLINRAYMEIQGKYEKILKDRSSEIINEMGRMYGVPTSEINDYIDTSMQRTDGDISFISAYLRPLRDMKDLSLRLTYRSVVDINNHVQEFANEKALFLIREFLKINKSDQLLYFEKDKDGKATGYVVRNRRYGEFKSDYRSFLKQLDLKYGVVDGNYYNLSEDEFHKYLDEKEDWLNEHCERKFKPDYYKAYNSLKIATRLKMKSLNGEIQSLIESVTDDEGIHLEKLSDKDWAKLDSLYQVKRNLANIYNFDGTEKVGEAREIAEDLTKFYETIGSGSIKSLAMTKELVNDIIAQKKAQLSKEDFEKWQRRNISYQFSDEFLQLIKHPISLDTMQEEYDDLLEQRRKLMNLGRNNNLPRTEASLLSDEVKEKIKDIDIRLDAIRSLSSIEKSDFDKYAKMVLTPQYEIDKKKAEAAGKEALAEWIDKTHYINSKGYQQVVSYYKMLIPKNSNYIEPRLSRMNLELDKDSKLVNENYDFDNPEYYQPKKSLYDNTEAFKKATNTADKKNIYNLITRTIKEANDKIPFMSKRDQYKLPQMTGDIVDFTCRGNKFWKGIYEYALDGVLLKNDDADYSTDNFTQKPDGSQLKFIPTHYILMLDNPEHISRNLVGMLTEYSKMAENYKIKNERISEYEVLADQMASRKFTIANAFRRTKSTQFGKNTKTYEKFLDFLDMNMYGQLALPFVTKPFGKDKNKLVSVTKIFNKIKNYASASNLGNNLSAITKALFQGLSKSTVEAFAGRYFSSGHYYSALARNIFNIPRMLYHLGDASHDDTVLALMESAGIARDIEDKIGNMQYNRWYRILSKNIIWGGWAATDYLVKAPVVEAIYSDYKYIPSEKKFMSKRKFIRELYGDDWKVGKKEFDKISSFTLRDVYTVKDGIPVIKSQYSKYKNEINDQDLLNSVRNISKFITNRIDGMLSQEDKTKVMTNAVGACIMMHRSFFINNMEDNIFASMHYNPYIEDYYEAKYTSTFKVLWKWISNLFNLSLSANSNSNKIESILLYNFKRTMLLLGMIGMQMLLVSLWLKPSADDDKKSYIKNFIGYSVDASVFEERAEYNPFDLFNLIKSPSAAIAPVENVTNIIKIFDPLHFENNFKEINKGPYKKQKRWQRSLIKATPGLRGLWESRDPRTKWEYLESQLDK